jgi:hypothetical protein
MSHACGGKPMKKAPAPKGLVDVQRWQQVVVQGKKLQRLVQTHEWGVPYALAKWMMEGLRKQPWPKVTYFKPGKHLTPEDINKQNLKTIKDRS